MVAHDLLLVMQPTDLRMSFRGEAPVVLIQSDDFALQAMCIESSLANCEPKFQLLPPRHWSVGILHLSWVEQPGGVMVFACFSGTCKL